MTKKTSPWHERKSPQDAQHVLSQCVAQGYWGAPHQNALIVHDLSLMRRRLRDLKACFPKQTVHGLAIKANPLMEILQVAVREESVGLEAASFGEVSLAIAAGCSPEQIIYDSPAKSTYDLKRALTAGVHINADNLEELERIATLRTLIPTTTSTVGLRINPLTGSGNIHMTSVAVRGSKFGVPLDKKHHRLLLDAYARHSWLTGVHVHVGSQGCPMEMLVDAVCAIARFRLQVHEHCGGARITTVDLGGGLPTVYHKDDPVFTMKEYANALRHARPELFEEDVRLMTEFGRIIQAGCGFAVSRIEYVKDTGAGQLATVHLGADFMLRRAYRAQDWHYDFAVLDAKGAPKHAEHKTPISLGGPLCFSGDILARDLLLPPVSSKDLLFYSNVGGYTLSMWSRYCSRAIPNVVGVEEDGSLVLLRRAETDEDLIQWWSQRPTTQMLS